MLTPGELIKKALTQLVLESIRRISKIIFKRK
jgi:hypothetical protein